MSHKQFNPYSPKPWAGKSWAEEPVRAEYRSARSAIAEFIDNGQQEAARKAVMDMVPARYLDSVKVLVVPFDKRVADRGDPCHTGAALATWPSA